MIEKGLELDKTNFAANGYEVDEEQYLQQSDKNASSSSKAKMKAYEVINVDLFEENMDDEDVVLLGNENATLDPNAQDSSNDNNGKGNLEGQSIPLIGSWLGVVRVGKEGDCTKGCSQLV